MVVQKHRSWVLPCLFPETNPKTDGLVNTDQFYFFFFKSMCGNQQSLPVNVEVKLALLFQLGEQLLFRLSDSHPLGKHGVHKELAGLEKKTGLNDQYWRTMISNNPLIIQTLFLFLPPVHSLVIGTLSPCIHPFSVLFLVE